MLQLLLKEHSTGEMAMALLGCNIWEQFYPQPFLWLMEAVTQRERISSGRYLRWQHTLERDLQREGFRSRCCNPQQKLKRWDPNIYEDSRQPKTSYRIITALRFQALLLKETMDLSSFLLPICIVLMQKGERLKKPFTQGICQFSFGHVNRQITVAKPLLF